MLISDILKDKGHDVFSIAPDKTVYEAIEKMADKNIGALLVMDNQKLAGIISERDYRNKVILKGRRSKTTHVREIMTAEVYYITPEDTIDTGMQLMTNNKFRHLPVLDTDKNVVGVVSIGDLVKAIISKQKGEISHLRHYISGTYPA